MARGCYSNHKGKMFHVRIFDTSVNMWGYVSKTATIVLSEKSAGEFTQVGAVRLGNGFQAKGYQVSMTPVPPPPEPKPKRERTEPGFPHPDTELVTSIVLNTGDPDNLTGSGSQFAEVAITPYDPTIIYAFQVVGDYVVVAYTIYAPADRQIG